MLPKALTFRNMQDSLHIGAVFVIGGLGVFGIRGKGLLTLGVFWLAVQTLTCWVSMVFIILRLKADSQD